MTDLLKIRGIRKIYHLRPIQQNKLVLHQLYIYILAYFVISAIVCAILCHFATLCVTLWHSVPLNDIFDISHLRLLWHFEAYLILWRELCISIIRQVNYWYFLVIIEFLPFCGISKLFFYHCVSPSGISIIWWHFVWFSDILYHLMT